MRDPMAGGDIATVLQAHEEERAVERTFMRFLVGGNAGGVIACLSLMGTAIGSSPTGQAPESFFWILLVFISGLGAAWWRLAMAIFWQKDATRRAIRGGRVLPDFAMFHSFMERWTLRVSGAALLIGTVGGVISLYTLTG